MNNSKATPVFVILLVIAAFLVGSFWTKIQYLEGGKGNSTQTPQPVAQQQQQQPQQPVVKIEQVKDAFSKSKIKFGDANSKLVIVEISDPSCPYCQVAAGKNGALNKQIGNQFVLIADGGTYVAPVPEIKKLVDGGKASFTYVYFPGHGSGEMGTKAMYCAFDAGKFWQVHDKLMSAEGYDLLNNTVKNDKTKSTELSEFLKGVFDAGEMKTCLDSGKYDAQLQTDMGLARDLGVQGTPGFFVNATNFGGAYSFKDMQSAVDAVLTK